MYLFLALTSFLKTFNPYFRKHILLTLESHEYLFLNTFLIAIFVFLYFSYKSIYHDTFLDKFVNKIYNLNITQFIFLLLIAFITIISSVVIINLDKYFNTPLINSLMAKSIAGILLIIVGTIIFREKYNIKQLFGFFLTIVGLFFINCKD
jgi:drug/metabolite transporter (DMT)-like permease